MNRKKSAALLLAAVMIAAMLMTGQENAYALRYESFLDADAMFTERDMLQNPDVSDAVPIDVTDGAQIALTEEGTYLLGGTASDALIIVDAPEDAKVQLVLDGLTLTNSSLPCIYVKSADKVFLTVQGENTLRVNGELVSDGSARIDGAVFSRSDLVLNGLGTLNISSTDNGIVTKDEQKALVEDLQAITGQKPMLCKAKKSISNFKLREGMVIGAKVTLRGDRMWEFLDRLIAIAIPRIRDFRGISPKSFDGRGNFSMGVTEQLIFPEIDYDKIDRTRGMDITIVTTANTNEEGKALLDAFHFPFKAQ